MNGLWKKDPRQRSTASMLRCFDPVRTAPTNIRIQDSSSRIENQDPLLNFSISTEVRNSATWHFKFG